MIPVEIALGVALALGWRPRITFAATAVMLVMFMGAIGFALATDQPLEGCGCFGRAIPRTPQQTLAEDALFLGLAVLGWVALGGGAPARTALARRTWKAAAVMVSAVVSGAFALASPHLPID